VNLCNRIVRSAACGLAAACAAALPLAAGAHEEREIGDGRFNVVVGFIDEPAFVGEKNGLSLEVTDLTAPVTPDVGEAGGEEPGGAPVLGLADTLRAEVIYGEETMELELVPAFGELGRYLGYFFPTAEGDYTYRVFGDIQGVAVDERFTSSPEGFDSVAPRLEFPSSEPSNARDGAGLASIGVASGGFPGGSGAGLLLGAVGAAGVGVMLARRRLTAAPVAVRT
jgi:hypothetical protein